MSLTEFWKTNKKKNPKDNRLIYATIFFVLLLGLGIGLNLPKKESDLDRIKNLTSNIESEIKLPEVILGDSDLNPDDPNKLDIVNDKHLKVISANMIGIYSEAERLQEDPEATAEATPTLAGIRVVGEVQNIGKSSVTDAKVLVRFFDKERTPVATRIGAWNQTYKFLPLAPNEFNVYDVLIPNPPESESITIEFEPADASTPESVNAIKIKNKSLNKQTATGNNRQITYYTLTGQLVNISGKDIVSPGVYVWLKNEENKIIALGSKIFDTDLLEPDQELEVELIASPLTTGDMETFEIKTFAIPTL
jgi:hypothetical protein